MAHYRKLRLPVVLFSAIFVLAGCYSGPAVSGAFDRSYSVTGPLRLELANASGDVDITGSADGKVHVHGEVRASGFGHDTPRQRLDEPASNPPMEQLGDAIPIGKEFSGMHKCTITSTVQVPRD